MAKRKSHRPDLLVVGGGVIGLAVAWRMAGRGLAVTIADPDPGRGASHVAAGMLAPVAEAHSTEQGLLRLNLESASRYPGFVAELTEATGLDTGYRQTGTVLAALDGDDLAVAGELYDLQRSLGLAVQRLDSREVRALEPLLAPGVRGGLLVDGDHQVDPRLLVSALLDACRRASVHLERQAVTAMQISGDRAAGATLADGTAVSTPQVLVAAGCWSNGVSGLPPGVLPELRPVKGQLMRLQVPAAYRPLLRHTLRGLVGGASVYLVPRDRPDGELVLGATVEEQGFDTTVTAGAVYELLRDARALLPAITELPLVETLAGLRPATPDNAPVLGPTALPGLAVAVGHHRNGVLLAPVTADALTAALTDGELPAVAAPFGPGRFATGAAA